MTFEDLLAAQASYFSKLKSVEFSFHSVWVDYERHFGTPSQPITALTSATVGMAGERYYADVCTSDGVQTEWSSYAYDGQKYMQCGSAAKMPEFSSTVFSNLPIPSDPMVVAHPLNELFDWVSCPADNLEPSFRAKLRPWAWSAVRFYGMKNLRIEDSKWKDYPTVKASFEIQGSKGLLSVEIHFAKDLDYYPVYRRINRWEEERGAFELLSEASLEDCHWAFSGDRKVLLPFKVKSTLYNPKTGRPSLERKMNLTIVTINKPIDPSSFRR